jgi:pimeloyl-ACP methyl ester carboxylesterase
MPRPKLSATLRDFAGFRPAKSLGPASVRGCPSGDGSPVLVLPGILHGDGQTEQFRACLQMLGYTPLPWELGVNVGPTPVTMEKIGARVSILAQRYGKLRLVGFSMGGLFARWIAQSRSLSVAQVITICAPFRDPLNSAWIPLGTFKPFWQGLDVSGLSFMMRQTPLQPWAALYSRKDGVVAWQSCLDPQAPAHCFDVAVRHRTAMREEAVFRQVAACLADVRK